MLHSSSKRATCRHWTKDQGSVLDDLCIPLFCYFCLVSVAKESESGDGLHAKVFQVRAITK